METEIDRQAKQRILLLRPVALVVATGTRATVWTLAIVAGRVSPGFLGSALATRERTTLSCDLCCTS